VRRGGDQDAPLPVIASNGDAARRLIGLCSSTLAGRRAEAAVENAENRPGFAFLEALRQLVHRDVVAAKALQSASYARGVVMGAVTGEAKDGDVVLPPSPKATSIA